MKNKTGKHTFTKSYKAHKRVINSVKKWNTRQKYIQ
jgi:cell division protein YceG involved in septum cleavage